MLGYKIGTGDAISVGKNKVVCFGGNNGFIENGALLVAFIGVPNVLADRDQAVLGREQARAAGLA